MKVVHLGQGCEGWVATLDPESEPRMNIHKHARMTIHSRALLIERVTGGQLAGRQGGRSGRHLPAHGA